MCICVSASPLMCVCRESFFALPVPPPSQHLQAEHRAQRGGRGRREKKSTGFYSCHGAFQWRKMDLSLLFLYSASANLSGQIAGDRWRDTVT